MRDWLCRAAHQIVDKPYFSYICIYLLNTCAEQPNYCRSSSKRSAFSKTSRIPAARQSKTPVTRAPYKMLIVLLFLYYNPRYVSIFLRARFQYLNRKKKVSRGYLLLNTFFFFSLLPLLLYMHV